MNLLLLATGLAVGASWNGASSRTLVQEVMRGRQIPGMAAAVVREGTTIWSETFGLADLEQQVAVTPQTVFRFASVSKPMTAVAAMRLAAAERLSLEDEVGRLVEGLPPDLSHVTVRQLLTHQSGLRHYRSDEREPLRRYHRLSEVVLGRAGDGLLFEPGSRHSYSTHGYSLLGWALEKAAGRAFEETMRAQVFTPARMATARVDDIYALVPHRTRGYFLSLAGELRHARPVDPSDKYPGGGLCGTILDLAAFAAALQDDRLIPASARAAMWTPQTLADGNATDYGLGWHVGERDGRRFVFHTGSQPGTSAFLYMEPDTGMAAVLLANLEQVDFSALARRLVDVPADAPHPLLDRGIRGVRK